jgi:hypothetical protein
MFWTTGIDSVGHSPSAIGSDRGEALNQTERSAECRVSGVDRTSSRNGQIDADDPEPTWAAPIDWIGEVTFSPFRRAGLSTTMLRQSVGEAA